METASFQTLLKFQKMHLVCKKCEALPSERKPKEDPASTELLWKCFFFYMVEKSLFPKGNREMMKPDKQA